MLYRFEPPPPQVPGEPEPFLAPFWPPAGLTLAPDGLFYGTLSSNDVFRISPDGGALGLVQQFSSESDPQALDAALVVGPDGNLYSTSLGFLIIVPRDRGTVFRVSPLSGEAEVLRRTRPDIARPYRAWGYPVVPAVFVAGLAISVVNTLIEKPAESLIGVALVALGLPAYWQWRLRAPANRRPPVTIA